MPVQLESHVSTHMCVSVSVSDLELCVSAYVCTFVSTSHCLFVVLYGILCFSGLV